MTFQTALARLLLLFGAWVLKYERLRKGSKGRAVEKRESRDCMTSSHCIRCDSSEALYNHYDKRIKPEGSDRWRCVAKRNLIAGKENATMGG